MSNGLGWKTVELQIENLIPGMILAVEAQGLLLRWFGYCLKNQTWIPNDSFFAIASIISVAYAVGLISGYVSRAVLDFVSERGPRAVIFNWFAHMDRVWLTDILKDDQQFQQDLSNESKKHRDFVAFWNACYRGMMRKCAGTQEVGRRRSQGRLVRNLWLPASLGTALIIPNLVMALNSALAVFLLWPFVYAYAEYVNFAEAVDISRRPKSKA